MGKVPRNEADEEIPEDRLSFRKANKTKVNKNFMRIIGRLYRLIVSPHPSCAISSSGNISANAGAPDTFPVKGRL